VKKAKLVALNILNISWSLGGVVTVVSPFIMLLLDIRCQVPSSLPAGSVVSVVAFGWLPHEHRANSKKDAK